MGAIAIVQWVANTSDGGEPILTRPMLVVLGPLIATPQTGGSVGYELEDLGLSYQIPVQPLGKTWSSRKLYPLISPMFRDTRLCDTDHIIASWEDDWNSIYQFDHGLKACYSIAVTDDPIDLSATALLEQPLWSSPTGSQVTIFPAENAAMVSLSAGGPPDATGAWTVSSMLLIPAGGNLPIGFAMTIDEAFSRNSFLQKLAGHHGDSLAQHVDSWLQGSWSDSWFYGVQRSPEMFATTMFSWSQVRDTMDTLMATDASASTQACIFSTLKWQGITRMHHDKLINHILPTLTPQVTSRLLKYYERRDIILANTRGFPSFPKTDQFLGYTLCPPSTKEWTKKLDLGPLIMVSQRSPWVWHFQPVIVDPSRDYTSVALTKMDSQQSGTSQPGAVSMPEGTLVTPGTQNNTAARLQVALQFFADVSQAGSPSDKVGSPVSSLQTRSANISWIPHFQRSPQRALFYPNAPSYQGSTNPQVLGHQDQPEPPTQQWSQVARKLMESISISTGHSETSDHQEQLKTLPSLKFVYQEIIPRQHWLQPHTAEEDQGHRGWFDCLPVEAIVLKKSKDDPSHAGKHDLQWSGHLFRSQANT